MITKKDSVHQKKRVKVPDLPVIRVGEFKPSLQTLSSIDCGIDLSGYAYAGLKNWK